MTIENTQSKEIVVKNQCLLSTGALVGTTRTVVLQHADERQCAIALVPPPLPLCTVAVSSGFAFAPNLPDS